MLKKIRIALAAIFFIGITLLLIGCIPALSDWIGWMPKLQFLPAALALNVAVIVGILLLTIIFGRIYCSVICPLGVWQDIVSKVFRPGKKNKMRFSYSPEKKWLRYIVWVLFVAAIIAGVQVFVALLAPYSAYGRFIQTIVGPIRTLPTVLIAIATILVVSVLAWMNGRTWCNTICPVGTTLSFFSRFAIFRPVIDTDKCKNCHICEKSCKASCIDIKNHKIDYSRCVDCFDCIGNCKFDSMHYGFAYGKKKASAPADEPAKPAAAADASRRAFIASAVIVGSALTVKAEEKKIAEAVADTTDKKRDGGLADIIAKVAPERECPITPFGSKGIKNFYDHCTACQLCVAACPNNVLRPSTKLDHLMQPEMSYESGYCRPECTKCSQVCPSGAILPITPEEKTVIHIGLAAVDYDLCVVNRDGVSCGNCSRHCPVGAIRMVRKDEDDPDSLRIPAVDESRCIGCGACENLCPSRPISAIKVNGRRDHIVEVNDEQ